MKKLIGITAILLLLTTCSNPMLKWIDEPEEVTVFSNSAKMITSFSFGIAGEAVAIGVNPDPDTSKIPITVVLPSGNDPSRLTPAITFIGASMNPRSGEAGDFRGPVGYRVFAEDGTSQDYTALVNVKTSASRAIVLFELELPKEGTHTLAGGVVTENTEDEPGTVVIYVPAGTDLTNLTAHIMQTGVSLRAPNARGPADYSDPLLTLTGDFSQQQTYTVRAENGLTKTYSVTVIKAKDSARAITALSFGFGNNETVLIGAAPLPDGKIPIVVTVPDSELRSNGDLWLQPTITYTGVSIEGEKISGSAPAGSVGTAQADADVNFKDPVIYTVTAEDGAATDYEVKVYASGSNSTKQITGFYFIFPGSPALGAAGIINETAKTIAVSVPYGTALQSLAPVVYHTGESISPISGQPENFSNSVTNPVIYTVKAKDGSTQPYKVSVFAGANTAKAITAFEFNNVPGAVAAIGSVPGADGKLPVVVTIPYSQKDKITALEPLVTHTGASLTGAGIPAGGPGTLTGTAADFSSPQTYTVRAEDNTSQDYTVTVILGADTGADPTSAAASIDAFYFNNPLALGTIDQTSRTITLTVPYGTKRDALIPTIHYSGKSVKLGSGTPSEENPAFLVANFSTPQDYTVTAMDGSATKTYTVTVNVAERPLSSAKEITSLSFSGFTAAQTAGTTTIISASPDSNGFYPIEVMVPFGIDLADLTPVITHTGVSITPPGGSAQSTPNPFTDSARDFSSLQPQTYRVTAENGTERDYRVTVRTEDNNAKAITGFYFTEPLAVGDIDQDAKTITVTVPYGTNLGSLRPTVYIKGVSLSPVSGMANNFTSTAVYTVSAANGTVQPYTVRVIARQSSAKEITGFTFPGVAVTDTVIGAIPGPDGKIPIAVTVAENTGLGALSPAISHTGKTISPASGSAQNFNEPVTYTVTAQDGSVKDYVVQVHRAGSNSKIITGFSFRAVPVTGGQTVPAVGSVDQARRAIEVVVPADADISALKPEIFYIGASITPPDGSPKTTKPFTDTERDFSNSDASPLSYTVAADPSDQLSYTVTVRKEEQNLGLAVTFVGISDPGLIDTSFDQSAGELSITMKAGNAGYTAPYEWYLDGGKLPVSSTENRLVLKTADLKAGRHEVVAVATGPAPKYLHYTNKVYFIVHE
jgi:hypothetical protein